MNYRPSITMEKQFERFIRHHERPCRSGMQEFDSIQISLASHLTPSNLGHMVKLKAWNHQLSYFQTRTWWSVLCQNFGPGEKTLWILCGKYKRRKFQGMICEKMWRWSDCRQSTPRSYGSHWACEPSCAYLVLKIITKPYRSITWYDFAWYRARIVFWKLHRNWSRFNWSWKISVAWWWRLLQSTWRVCDEFTAKWVLKRFKTCLKDIDEIWNRPVAWRNS